MKWPTARPSPLQATALVAGASLLVRFLIAWRVQTPILFPDEYIHTALARSIVDGTFPHVRGGSVNFLSYLAPALMAPWWLISNVEVAYRVEQFVNCLIFSAAAFPAFLLARRIGIAGYGATVVALLAVLVPDGVYTMNLIAEPYAYPAMLLATLIAVDAIARPSAWRQAAVIAASGVLVLLAGAQMVVFGAAYVPASFLARRGSVRGYLRDQALVLAAIVVGAVTIGVDSALQPNGRLGKVWQTATQTFHYPLVPSLEWFGVNLFVLAIAVGWVAMPGALLGLGSLIRSPEGNRKAFGYLTALLMLGLLLEAVPFGVNVQSVLERYAFYAVPLLAACFVHAWQHGLLRTRAYVVLACCAAVAALLLPVNGPLLESDIDEAPSVLGITQWGWHTANIWGPVLAVVAAAFAWRRLSRWVAPAAVVACAVTSVLISYRVVLGSEGFGSARVSVPDGTPMVTWAAASRFNLMRTLFWNRHLTDVIVFGLTASPDGFPFLEVGLRPGPRVVAANGRRFDGPFVFQRDVVVLGGGKHVEHNGLLTVERPPKVIAFGWDRASGFLNPGGAIFAAATSRPQQLDVRLRVTDGDPKKFQLFCDYAFRKEFRVAGRSVTLRVPVRPNRSQECHLKLLEGSLRFAGPRPGSIEGSLALRPVSG